MAGKIHIRKLKEISEFEKLLDIQRIIWNHDETDLTPVHQFCISYRMGGILLGAFVDGKLAGFVYSFPAIDGKRCWQHSHLLAVLPEFQGLGIGKRLKWAQRTEALKQGLDLITWTFDPLLAKNANLNFHTLSVKSHLYYSRFYGFIPSLCLAPGIPTDRLLVEWPLGENPALERGAGRSGPLDIGIIPRALEQGEAKGGPFPMPAQPKMNIRKRIVLVELPPDVHALKPYPEVITAWQSGLRRVMQGYFKRGYAADDFVFGERCFYVLRKS